MASKISERNRLVESNLGLAYFEAAKNCYRNRGIDLEDLRSEAAVALVAAANHFDFSRGLRFSTYAVPCIRHALQDALLTAAAVRTPKGWAAKRREVAEAMRESDDGKKGATAIFENAARKIGASVKKMNRWISFGNRAEILSGTFWDSVSSESRTPEENALFCEIVNAVSSSLLRLRKGDPKGYEVILRHRGFFSENGKGESFSEIGRAMNMTRQNVCAIEKRAVRFLTRCKEIRALV